MPAATSSAIREPLAGPIVHTSFVLRIAPGSSVGGTEPLSRVIFSAVAPFGTGIVAADTIANVGHQPPGFTELLRRGGYLPIEDHGLIGDGTTAALIGRDGSLDWLCAPRFDSPPLFGALLDRRRGGSLRVAPDAVRAARQYYEPETAILSTELLGETGTLRITDALCIDQGALQGATPEPAHELVRSIEVLDGELDVRIRVDAADDLRVRPSAEGLSLERDDGFSGTLRLEGGERLTRAASVHRLQRGARVALRLSWGSPPPVGRAAAERLSETRAAWRAWIGNVAYDGPQPELVRRAAITLKLLDYTRSGAIVAAPTSSLPEEIGGERNWDYRYSWVRDTAFAVYALRRIGLTMEADRFLAWVLEAAERHQQPHILYDVDGQLPAPERTDPRLEGYRQSRPVRWGNAAAEQRQNDVYGEIMDCAYQWVRGGGRLEPAMSGQLRALVETAGRVWREPDHGIWEVRTLGRPFTYSVALCHVALDRGVRLADRLGAQPPALPWRQRADEIRDTILSEAWDPERGALTEHLGGGGLDASLLALPLRRVLEAAHPRMTATVDAIMAELGAGHGLLYRYLPERSPDGLQGHEGAFLLCSFWLVDNLAQQGRLDEAMSLYDSLCARAGHLGLLPEEVEPSSGAFLGNYPQAFSHIGLISSGVGLAREVARSGT